MWEEVVERRKGRWNGGYWGQLSGGGEEARGGVEVRGARSCCERWIFGPELGEETLRSIIKRGEEEG